MGKGLGDRQRPFKSRKLDLILLDVLVQEKKEHTLLACP